MAYQDDINQMYYGGTGLMNTGPAATGDYRSSPAFQANQTAVAALNPSGRPNIMPTVAGQSLDQARFAANGSTPGTGPVTLGNMTQAAPSTLGGVGSTGTGQVDPNAPNSNTQSTTQVSPYMQPSSNSSVSGMGTATGGQDQTAPINLSNMGNTASFKGGALAAAAPLSNSPPNQSSPNTGGVGSKAPPLTMNDIQTQLNANHGYQQRDGSGNHIVDDSGNVSSAYNITLPNIGTGTYDPSSNEFLPTNQHGVPAGYRGVYTADANGNFTPSLQRNTGGSRVMDALGNFIHVAAPLGIGMIAGGMLAPALGAAATTAGNTAGLSAGTMSTIGQGLNAARYARTGYNLYNMGK